MKKRHRKETRKRNVDKRDDCMNKTWKRDKCSWGKENQKRDIEKRFRKEIQKRDIKKKRRRETCMCEQIVEKERTHVRIRLFSPRSEKERNVNTFSMSLFYISFLNLYACVSRSQKRNVRVHVPCVRSVPFRNVGKRDVYMWGKETCTRREKRHRKETQKRHIQKKHKRETCMYEQDVEKRRRNETQKRDVEMRRRKETQKTDVEKRRRK